VSEESWACGKTVGDINIPSRTGAIVVAVVIENKPHANPDQKLLIQSGDIFILLGSHIQLDQSLKMLRYGHSGGGEKSNLT
jgi:K+/H+ antiporter YhaU regulatory subunit KhtT